MAYEWQRHMQHINLARSPKIYLKKKNIISTGEQLTIAKFMPAFQHQLSLTHTYTQSLTLKSYGLLIQCARFHTNAEFTCVWIQKKRKEKKRVSLFNCITWNERRSHVQRMMMGCTNGIPVRVWFASIAKLCASSK